MKLGTDRVDSLFVSNHNLLARLHRPPPSLPDKPDHLERHPLRLDLRIAQDRSADATKAKGLETRFSRRTRRARPLLVGPSGVLCIRFGPLSLPYLEYFIPFLLLS